MTEGLTGWDAWFKALFQAAPQTYTHWLLSGAQFEGFESPELASRNPRTDLLVRTRLHDKEVLLHVEFQSASDPTMPHRLLEYNVLAEKKYKISIYSCVIYTEKAHEQACSPYIKTLPGGTLVYEFRFGSINLQDLNTKELIKRKQSGLLPLLPLTRQGHDLDAIDRMITQLHEEKDTELLALALAMASICLEEDAKATAWLQRRKSMLSEEDFTNNWFIQGFLNKGLAQGKAEGKAEGLQQYLVSLTQARFPELLTLAKQCAAKITDPDQLQQLALQLAIAPTSEEAHAILQTPPEKPSL